MKIPKERFTSGGNLRNIVFRLSYGEITQYKGRVAPSSYTPSAGVTLCAISRNICCVGTTVQHPKGALIDPVTRTQKCTLTVLPSASCSRGCSITRIQSKHVFLPITPGKSHISLLIYGTYSRCCFCNLAQVLLYKGTI